MIKVPFSLVHAELFRTEVKCDMVGYFPDELDYVKCISIIITRSIPKSLEKFQLNISVDIE